VLNSDTENRLLPVEEGGTENPKVGDEDGDEPGEGGPKVEGETKVCPACACDEKVVLVDEDEDKGNVVGTFANGDPGTVEGGDRAVSADIAEDEGESGVVVVVIGVDVVFGDEGKLDERLGLAAPIPLSFIFLFEVDIARPESCRAFIRSAMLPPGLESGTEGGLGCFCFSNDFNFASTACILEVKLILSLSIKSANSFFTPVPFPIPFPLISLWNSAVPKTIFASCAAMVNAVSAPFRSPSPSHSPGEILVSSGI
jgi:hypothetical protein